MVLKSVSMFIQNFTITYRSQKTLKIKGFQQKKRRSLEIHFAKCTLKNDFTVFPKHESAVEFSQVRKYFLMM
jgi:Fe-S cluster assembly protein SufD